MEEQGTDHLEIALEIAWETLQEEHLSLGKVSGDDPYSLERLSDLHEAALAYVAVLDRIRAVYGPRRDLPLDE
jgi:hypothetical protein